MDTSLSKGNDSALRSKFPSISEPRIRPLSSNTLDTASPSALSVSTFQRPSASIDNSPPASATSSSPSSPNSLVPSSWAPESHPRHVSPFAHPLDSDEPGNSNGAYPQFSQSAAHDQFGGGHNSHMPMTPGEVIFDRGLLFASNYRPSTRSGPSNAVSSTPLPSLPTINRSSSDLVSSDVEGAVLTVSAGAAGEAAGAGAGAVSSIESSAEQQIRGVNPREVRSTPINMPVIHHPVPVPSNRASTVHSQGFPSRTPSPNPSMTTQGSITSNQPFSSKQQHLSPIASSTSLPGNSGQRHPYTQYSTPAALRPDSVCSFPDNSPLMAPNVLAAVDARLKESSRQRALAQQSSASSLRPSRTQQSLVPGTTHSNGSVDSKASSLAPVLTHLSVLQSSEAITSREQLYDILNKDDEEDAVVETDSLGKPNPGFIKSSRQSSKSSSRNSFSSSSLNGSGIELNATGERYLAASLPRPAQARVNEGSARSGDRRELVAAAMVSNAHKERESYPSSDKEFSNPYSSTHLEKSEWLKRKSRSSRKWRGICCVVGIIAFIAVIAGIVLGFITRKGKIDGLAPPPNPDKPPAVIPPITQFTPNPNLRKAFYGIDYNPAKSLMPWCGVTLQEVVNDVILISQMTNRIRLYGMDCAQADLTFQAINVLNLNNTMKVVLTLWVDKDPTTYQRQYDTLFKVLDTYGTSMVQGISVGNEVLFRQDMNLTSLGGLMASVRANIKTRYNKSIPVFTSEIGNNLNATLAAVSDELEGNLHPYFAGMAVSGAANWTFQQYNDTILANPTQAGIKGAISEVGWPSAPASAVYQTYAIPGLANLQTMVDTFICQANAQGIPYYWFEFKDEPWKTDPTVPVEPYWGIFDKDGNLKIQIPNCIAP